MCVCLISSSTLLKSVGDTDFRPKICHDLHGFTYLIEVLDLGVQDAEERAIPISDKDIELSCEILKILFNLTVSVDKNNLDEVSLFDVWFKVL